ncbi:asparagine synthase-related protein [Ornithinimicrobium sp. LYQ92]|uniref:asparagine synthase-related protein n=1 Tax=Serinicoccus sp. LYQ92 TaxID=3378798 RepID=UPI003853D68E
MKAATSTMLAESYGSAEPLLFARGFLLWDNTSLRRPTILDRLRWQEHSDLPGGWMLAHAPRMEMATARYHDGTVLILGEGVASDIDSSEPGDLATWVAAAESDEQFQQRVDAISGRFAVFRINDQQMRVQNDVQGLRAVFHTDVTHPCVLGSHVDLVGEVVRAPDTAFASPTYHQRTNLRTPPGRHTTRHGVLALLPNTELVMPSRQVRRIYPRTPREQRSTAEVVLMVERELTTTLALLLAAGPPVVTSLSAGLDSRLTLALLRQHLDHVSFFTYDVANVNNRANQHDTGDALALVARFGLAHNLINVEGSAPAEIRKVLAANRHRAHSPGLAVAYQQAFPRNAVHLRSNGNGTLTAWYQRGDWPEQAVTAEYRMQLASQAKCHDLGVLDAFTDAWRATEARKVEALGHSGLDFAYAEDRMGVWHQNIVQESDIAFETRVPFGSRRLVDLMLSAPLEDRMSGRILVDLIRRQWPDVLSVPINGVEVPVDGAGGLWEATKTRSEQRTVLTRAQIMERSR